MVDCLLLGRDLAIMILARNFGGRPDRVSSVFPELGRLYERLIDRSRMLWIWTNSLWIIPDRTIPIASLTSMWREQPPEIKTEYLFSKNLPNPLGNIPFYFGYWAFINANGWTQVKPKRLGWLIKDNVVMKSLIEQEEAADCTVK